METQTLAINNEISHSVSKTQVYVRILHKNTINDTFKNHYFMKRQIGQATFRLNSCRDTDDDNLRVRVGYYFSMYECHLRNSLYKIQNNGNFDNWKHFYSWKRHWKHYYCTSENIFVRDNITENVIKS